MQKIKRVLTKSDKEALAFGIGCLSGFYVFVYFVINLGEYLRSIGAI